MHTCTSQRFRACTSNYDNPRLTLFLNDRIYESHKKTASALSSQQWYIFIWAIPHNPYPDPVYTVWSSAHWSATGMLLVDPVYTGMQLDDPASTCRVHWDTIVFVYLELKFKWNQQSSHSIRHSSCIHTGLHAGQWPDLMTTNPDSVGDTTGQRTLEQHWLMLSPSGAPVAIQCQFS